MRTKISPYVEAAGLQMPFDKFIKEWANYAGRDLKPLPFKHDLRYWNDKPWTMQPNGCFAAMVHDRFDGDVCIGVFEIWKRNDGLGIEVYKFDTMADYEAYNISQESPDAIKREIGLCVNYHKGI